MEAGSKRRKIDHGGSGLRHDGLIDFESRKAAQLSTASTFVLETDELLREAKLDYEKALKDVDQHLFRLKNVVDAIEPHGPIPVSNSRRGALGRSDAPQITEATSKFEKKHRIVIPYPEPKPTDDLPYKLSYDKPSQCNVVGSYVSKTMVKSQEGFGVDMVIQMPQSLFQEKDYMNMRYFYRRAYYIAYVAAHVRKEMGDAMEARFELLDENPLLPILVLQPTREKDPKTNGKLSKSGSKVLQYLVRLIPCAPDGLFPWSKLSPSSNCVRLEASENSKTSANTPFYNSTINAERTFIQYLRVLTHAKSECAAFADACILGRIWLQQRGFGGSISRGGFGHFEWTAMLALLLQTGGRNGQAALSTSLSSTELFKAGIQFLSTTDFIKKPFAFRSTSVDSKAIREPCPVMFDPVREVNIAFKMTPWSASLLQFYAKSTADLLADEGAEAFEPIFILKADVIFQVFDAVFELSTADPGKASKSPDRSGPARSLALEVHKVLKRAFGNRAQLVHIQQQPLTSWSLANSEPKASTKLLIGVIFDPAHMSKQMEYGPPAEEQKEAVAFRQFWGEKAELRRFKDGSILECVEWAGKMAFEISEDIARYALKRHLNVKTDEVVAYGSGFADLLDMSHMDKESFDAARSSFTKFEHDIRSLEELPLQIRQLSATSASARYSSLEAPSIGYHKDSIEPMDVNLYFEASSKWPENLTAIQEAKIEFLLDFDRRLSSAHENVTTYLGRENQTLGIENLAYLDVVYESGAAFRLRLHCELEEALLERQVKNTTLDHDVREEAARSLNRLQWQYTLLPLHTQAIATYCTRLAPLSHSIRLAKHWFASHKLSSHFSDEVIELLVLHAFLQPYPWRVPSSPGAALLRTLFFLARWDWRDEPLIIDPAETITAEDRLSMRRELESWRQRDPHMNGNTVLFVATSNDQSGVAYTRNGPDKLIASRMTRLAKAACKLVREQGTQLDPQALFETSLHDYDVLIHLSGKAVRAIMREAATDAAATKHSQFKNLDVTTGKMPLPVRAHPTAVLVEELQRAYEDTFVFFTGSADDAVITAIWNPKLQIRQKFRAGLPYNFKRTDDDESDIIEVNKEAVLLEIARVGGDMIRKIEVVA